MPSPTNCSFPGTIERRLVAASRNQAISATESSTMTAGRVSVQLDVSLPTIGHQKSSGPGGVKPPPSAASTRGLTASPPCSRGTSGTERRSPRSTPKSASEHKSPRTVPEPDQVERQRRSGQQADQNQPRCTQEVVAQQADAAEGDQPGEQVAEDAPGARFLQRTFAPVVRRPVWRWRAHVVKNRSSGQRRRC